MQITLYSDWMSKINALVRRIIWLGQTSPYEKSLVFSGFDGALDIVAKALTQHHIKSVRLAGGREVRRLIHLTEETYRFADVTVLLARLNQDLNFQMHILFLDLFEVRKGDESCCPDVGPTLHTLIPCLALYTLLSSMPHAVFSADSMWRLQLSI